MTWVFAQSTIFGQVLALSDIQVTINGNIYRDCLQKMYKFDENIIAGFAGNVRGALTLMNTFSKIFINSKKGDEKITFEPEEVINKWSINARNLFKKLLPDAQKGGIHFLVGGVSYTKDMGISGMGKPFVAKLVSPNFIPEYGKIGEWISIGSGSDVEKYKEILTKLSGEKTLPLAGMESQWEGGFASALGITLIIDIQKEAEVCGISKHFHISITSRKGGVVGGNSDHNEYIGDKIIEYKMPKVATNLTEFDELMKNEYGWTGSIVA